MPANPSSPGTEVIKKYTNQQPDYTHHFTIKYRRESAGYFAIWMTYGPLDPHHKSSSDHHLLPDWRLCQTPGRESRTFEHAEAFAFWWMKRWSIYVRTGTFPMTPEAVSVPDDPQTGAAPQKG